MVSKGHVDEPAFCAGYAKDLAFCMNPLSWCIFSASICMKSTLAHQWIVIGGFQSTLCFFFF